MDPNVALERLREALQDPPRDADAQATLEEAREAFDALDGWLSNGHFLPGAWRR